jgi:hypothetical protein
LTFWTYSQSTGQIYDSAMNPVGPPGYSGHGEGLNNPAMQNVPDKGPCPCGMWQGVELLPESTHGPNAIRLEPCEGTETFGRDGMFMHGDEIAHVGERLASLGCIVELANIRLEWWAEPEHLLNVVASIQQGESQ